MIDIYKEKFTSLQNEIIKFLFIKSGLSFNQRQIAQNLNVSPTAISKSIKDIEKVGIVIIKKESPNRFIVELNKQNPKIFNLKRVENLKMIYESGLQAVLSENFPACTIILFGSFSLGEDIIASDVDIAIIGAKEKALKLDGFEKILERKISLHFYKNFKEIDIKSGLSNAENAIYLRHHK